MDASLETLVTAAYVFACSLSIPRPGPRGNVTDQELIALAVAQAVTGLVSDRQFLGTIGRLLPGCFPELPGQSQFNRRLRRLMPQITRVQLGVAELLACGTLLGCANYAGCASKSEFAGQAAYGYCAAKSRWYWGMRLLLISDRRGAPLGYDLRPAGENEREGVFALASAHPGSLLFADAGRRGREYHESLQLVGVELIVPDKHRLGERPSAETSKARIRLVIESAFATLKGQMRLEEHLAKTLPGLAQRIVQRLLALTLGMFINTLLGRASYLTGTPTLISSLHTWPTREGQAGRRSPATRADSLAFIDANALTMLASSRLPSREVHHVVAIPHRRLAKVVRLIDNELLGMSVCQGVEHGNGVAATLIVDQVRFPDELVALGLVRSAPRY